MKRSLDSREVLNQKLGTLNPIDCGDQVANIAHDDLFSIIPVGPDLPHRDVGSRLVGLNVLTLVVVRH